MGSEANERPRKKIHQEGTSDKQTNRHTSRRLDQLGPDGRVGVNFQTTLRLSTVFASASFPPRAHLTREGAGDVHQGLPALHRLLPPRQEGHHVGGVGDEELSPHPALFLALGVSSS